MSQEKVNRYKSEKKNRKKNAAKAKRTALYINLFLIAVALIICVFIAWSIYAEFFKKETPVKTVNKLSSGEITRIIDRNKEEETTAESETESQETSSEQASSENNE